MLTTPSHRREFLTGKAVVRALNEQLDAGVTAEAGSGGSGYDAALRDSYLMTVERAAMACRFAVLLNSGQYEQGVEAALTALDRVEELESQLSVYRPDSEVSTINRTAATGPVACEARLFALFQLAGRLHAETAGAYDPTSGPLSKVWGFFDRAGRVPEAAALAAAREKVGWQHVSLDAAEQTIRFARSGMELNLGSIGKGYALDRAAEELTSAGVGDFLLHGGRSSVLARGSRREGDASPGQGPDGWRVGVVHPLFPDRRLAQVSLRDQALGTSGTATQHFRHGGRRYGHILDPRTGEPAERVLSITVVAPTAAEADALATGLFVAGRDVAAECCARRPEIAVLCVLPGRQPGRVAVEALGFSPESLIWEDGSE